MTSCETTDFMYPMKADIYFPILAQGDYGQPKKDWVYDRTIICNATPVGGAGTEDIKPETFLQYENKFLNHACKQMRKREMEDWSRKLHLPYKRESH